MKFRLPPLNTLRLFEAAGRRLNFRTASQELGITASAISHGIQSLEDWLGSALFHRSGRSIALTPAGAAYLPAVTEALRLLRYAADQAVGFIDGVPLNISAPPAFASRILIPRLHSFRSRHPTIAVSIDTSHIPAEISRNGADVVIRRDHGNVPGHAERLLTETLVPVCSPLLLDRIGNTSLSATPLIHVVGVDLDWQAWSKASGEEEIDFQKGLTVDTFEMAIEAAVQGLGVAIGRLPFISEELASGQLVRFRNMEVAAEQAYWLVAAPGAMSQQDIRAFRAWLLEELELMGATNLLNDGGQSSEHG